MQLVITHLHRPNHCHLGKKSFFSNARFIQAWLVTLALVPFFHRKKTNLVICGRVCIERILRKKNKSDLRAEAAAGETHCEQQWNTHSTRALSGCLCTHL